MSVSGTPGGVRTALNITSTTPVLVYAGAARIARLIGWAGVLDGNIGSVFVYDVAVAASAGPANLIGQFSTGGSTVYEMDWPVQNGIVVKLTGTGDAAPGVSLSFTAT